MPILGQMGITTLFERSNCDFSGLSYEPAYCEDIVHATKLNVNRKGIEGAAVTILANPGAAAPDEFEDVYLQFVIDRAFGFIISDAYGNTLFSGVVKTV